MLRLLPERRSGEPLRLLCIGAHSDDREIGCGGTLLTWLAERSREASRSARALLRQARRHHVVLGEFRDGLFPVQYASLKEYFERLRRSIHARKTVI